MKNAKDILAEMPTDRRAAIEARSGELLAEEMTLQDIRKARKLTQVQLAAALGIRQESVSRSEKSADLLLSTLRSYVAAMGGTLDVVVTFPGRPPVSLSSIGETGSRRRR